jgi:hypothetical protein
VVLRENILRLLRREVVEVGGFFASGGGVDWSRGCVIFISLFARLFLDDFLQKSLIDTHILFVGISLLIY